MATSVVPVPVYSCNVIWLPAALYPAPFLILKLTVNGWLAMPIHMLLVKLVSRFKIPTDASPSSRRNLARYDPLTAPATCEQVFAPPTLVKPNCHLSGPYLIVVPEFAIDAAPPAPRCQI